jgi:hypothetical protein
MTAPKRTKAARGAYQLASLAIRNEVRRLDKLAKGGLVVDPEQRALLVGLADRAHQMAVSEGEVPADLFTQPKPGREGA